MKHKLFILIVEASCENCEILARHLEKSGFEISWESVKNAEEMQTVLIDPGWDAVISNLVLPEFSASAALATLKNSGVEIPFFVFSEETGEDALVEIMNEGAVDCFELKNLSRLVPAIKREVSDFAAKRDGRKASYNFRQAIMLAPFPIMIHAEDGTVLAINEAWTELTGYSLNDIPTMAAWTEKAYGSKNEEMLTIIRSMYDAGGRVHNGILNITTSNNSSRSWDFATAPLSPLADGRRVLISMAKDLTEFVKAEKSVRESEERLRLIMQIARAGCWDCDLTTGEVKISPEYREVYGLDPSQEQSYAEWQEVVHPADLPKIKQIMNEAYSKRMTYRTEFRIRHPKLGERWVEGMGQAFHDKYGCVVRVLGITLDISERKRNEEALSKSEEKYRALFEDAGDYIFIFSMKDPECPIIIDGSNDSFIHHGYTREELIGKPIWMLDLPGEFDKNIQVVKNSLKKPGDVARFESVHVRKDGTTFPMEASLRLLKLGQDPPIVISIERDISERKKAEEQLKLSLKEKEILLRELYHRTKNNMQVISSMLELQASEVDNAEAREAFRVTKNRIMAMSLVHQKLYQSKDLSNVDLGEYLCDLGKMLLENYNSSNARISMKCECEKIGVLIDVGVPCGLILNELVSNSLKHAFKGRDEGNLKLSVRKASDDKILIELSDDGVGVPDQFDFRKTSTLGLEMVFGLAERQLMGKVEFVIDNGLTCRLIFNPAFFQQRL